MEMNELIVIDEDNDLEEGEILDDVVPDVDVLAQHEEKPKQLPRRYTLHESSNGRHKNCKHKERTKFQNSSYLKTVHKRKHKSSCPRNSVENHRLKHRNHHVQPFPVKCAFKNYTSPPRAPPLSKNLDSNHQNSEIEFPQLLLEYKKAKEHANAKTEKGQDNSFEKNEPRSVSIDSKNSNLSQAKQESSKVLPLVDLTEEKNGEESDEDVEELRRIALATRAKKQLVIKIDDESSNEIRQSNSNIESSLNTVPLNHMVETLHVENDNDSHDNYEVVDMDLDEEESSCQIINDDNLFVIDKMPASIELSSNLADGQLSQNFHSHKFPSENVKHQQPSNSHPIDDFEEQLLRAEVIASMNSTHQKLPPLLKLPTPVEGKVSEIVAKVDRLQNEVKTLNNEMKKKPCTIYSKGPLQNSVRQPPKRIIDAKLNFSNFKHNKTAVPSPPLRGVNNVQERLIITLNNESSTDESEEEVNENVASQNVPMSSIEALISSARLKSDAAQLNNESSANVSCLSKAQQEEYNSLKKLLAEKTQYSVVPASVAKEKKPSNQTQIDLLMKKITVAKTNLEKEIGIKDQVQKILVNKKKNYLTSKLKVQLIKERLHAAEKIRTTNLENWKQWSAKLDVVKKSVSKKESLLKLLETELNAKNLSVEAHSKTPVQK